jgi:lipoate-protein ligase A
MSSVWRLLLSPAAPGAWNMAVDEAILEHVGLGASEPTLRLYAWEPACLSLGHAQPFADVDVDRLRQRGWDVVRRPTGGRAILHTDELTYSVMAPPDEPTVAGSLLESYNRLARALLQAARSLGLPAEMKTGQREQTGVSNPVCFEAPSAYEITVGGKKLIGSAQARRREGVLQHGSIPLTGDLTRITEALVFREEPDRAQAAERLLERATTAESVLGRHVGWEEAANAVRSGFKSALGLEFTELPLSETERQRADELVREKYAHHAWTGRA